MSTTLIIPNSILIPQIKQLIKEGRTTTFIVRGFSMRPFLEDKRDKVILAPHQQLKKGDVVLAEIQPQMYVLHRIIHMEADQVTLQGDGNIIGTEICRLHNVIGVAIGFYRKSRPRPDMVTGWKWRIYSFIWMKLRPLRRILLAVYRRIAIRAN